MIVCALPDEYFQLSILLAEFLEEITNFLLAEGIGKIVFLIIDEIRGHVGVKIVQGTDADPLQHHADIFVCMREICESCHITWQFLRKQLR